MVALILFLLWHPALSVATLRPQQNVVAVLVDDSRSMAIADAGGTREAAAQKVLDSGLLKALGNRFQVRLYKFGKEPERIQKAESLNASEQATRIGDTLEQVMAESSSLPLGAIVMLSDGADNAGGIDLATIAAIRRQRIPIHTVGFGREHPDRDVEITDAVVPARALPQSRLTAVVTFQSYGLSGSQAKLTVRDNGKVLAARDVTLKADGVLGSESLVFNCGDAGAKTLEIGIDPLPGEENTQNNKVDRVVNVETRTAAHPLYGRRTALGIQIHAARAALPAQRPASRRGNGEHPAHHAEQDSAPGLQGSRKSWPTAFPASRKTCSRSRD